MANEEEKDKLQKRNGMRPIEVTPMKLLAIILRVVLTDRITDEEVEKICSNYYKAIQDLWG